MKPTLSPRDRRTLTVGFGAVLGLIAIARGWPAYRAWETTQIDTANGVAERLAFARHAKQMLPAIRDSLAVRRLRLAVLDTTVITSNSPAAVAAMLASVVATIADSSDVKVNALQIRADSVARGPVTRVGVRLTGVTDIAGLAAFMRAMEEDDCPMVVRELSVNPTEPTAPDTKPEMLRVDLFVETIGFIKNGKAQ